MSLGDEPSAVQNQCHEPKDLKPCRLAANLRESSGNKLLTRDHTLATTHLSVRRSRVSGCPGRRYRSPGSLRNHFPAVAGAESPEHVRRRARGDQPARPVRVQELRPRRVRPDESPWAAPQARRAGPDVNQNRGDRRSEVEARLGRVVLRGLGRVDQFLSPARRSVVLRSWTWSRQKRRDPEQWSSASRAGSVRYRGS